MGYELGSAGDQAASALDAATTAANKDVAQAISASLGSAASLVGGAVSAAGDAALSALRDTASGLNSTADALAGISDGAQHTVDALSTPSGALAQQLLGSALALPQPGRRSLLQQPLPVTSQTAQLAQPQVKRMHAQQGPHADPSLSYPCSPDDEVMIATGFCMQDVQPAGPLLTSTDTYNGGRG